MPPSRVRIPPSPLRSRERCPSGLRSATGNRVRAERCVAGSNPALSALFRDGFLGGTSRFPRTPSTGPLRGRALRAGFKSRPLRSFPGRLPRGNLPVPPSPRHRSASRTGASRRVQIPPSPLFSGTATSEGRPGAPEPPPQVRFADGRFAPGSNPALSALFRDGFLGGTSRFPRTPSTGPLRGRALRAGFKSRPLRSFPGRLPRGNLPVPPNPLHRSASRTGASRRVQIPPSPLFSGTASSGEPPGSPEPPPQVRFADGRFAPGSNPALSALFRDGYLGGTSRFPRAPATGPLRGRALRAGFKSRPLRSFPGRLPRGNLPVPPNPLHRSASRTGASRRVQIPPSPLFSGTASSGEPPGSPEPPPQVRFADGRFAPGSNPALSALSLIPPSGGGIQGAGHENVACRLPPHTPRHLKPVCGYPRRVSPCRGLVSAGCGPSTSGTTSGSPRRSSTRTRKPTSPVGPGTRSPCATTWP